MSSRRGGDNGLCIGLCLSASGFCSYALCFSYFVLWEIILRMGSPLGRVIGYFSQVGLPFQGTVGIFVTPGDKSGLHVLRRKHESSARAQRRCISGERGALSEVNEVLRRQPVSSRHLSRALHGLGAGLEGSYREFPSAFLSAASMCPKAPCLSSSPLE